MKKVTILENDYIHENCPLDYVLRRFVRRNRDVEFNTWDRFSASLSTDKEKSINRLKKLSSDKDHVFLAYPSFVGYGNEFYGWVHFLNELRKSGIKLNIYIIYGLWESDGENLLFKSLEHYHGLKLYKKDLSGDFKKVIDFHDIKYISYDSAYSLERDLFNDFEKLSSKNIEDLYFEKGEKVIIESEGIIGTVMYNFYSESSHNIRFDVQYKITEDMVEDTTLGLHEIIKIK